MNEDFDMDGGIAVEEYNERKSVVNKDYFVFIKRTPNFDRGMGFFVVTMTIAIVSICLVFAFGS